MVTKEELVSFQDELKSLFLKGNIRAPIHLSRGNEEPLIEIFKAVKKRDWVFSNHRSHYHALLKGINRYWLRREILDGRSIHINSAKHRFMSSAIVGGCLPIAVGVAMAIKKKRSLIHVWVFVGDMAAESGTFAVCTKYAARHKLPITFIVEDNGLSTNTPTQLVWGKNIEAKADIIRYRYQRGFPHQGAGKWVIFK